MPTVDFAPKSPVPPAAGPAAPATLAGALPGELGLAELFAWLDVSMKKTDDEIRAQMNDIQGAKIQSEQLSRLLSEVRALKTAAGAAPDKGATPAAGTRLDEMRASFPGGEAEKEWLSKLSPDAQNAIHGFFGDLNSGDNKAHVNSFERLEHALSDEINAIGSSNEMKMIKLQSAISARGQAIQLVSNMLKSIDDTSMRIVGNV